MTPHNVPAENTPASFRRLRVRPKKDKILHVRVSGQLDDLIQRQADELKIPVSQLVRSMLEQRLHDLEAWVRGGKEIAEQFTEDVTRVAGVVETALGAPSLLTGRLIDKHRHGLRPEEILGWQEMVVAKPVLCAGCGENEIKKGEKAALAIHDGAKKYFYCLAFKEALDAGETPDHCLNAPPQSAGASPAGEPAPPQDTITG